MPLTIPEYIEIKTVAGATAAYLSPEADGLKDCWVNNELNGRCTLSLALPLPGHNEDAKALTVKGVVPSISAPESKWQYLNSFYRIYAPDIAGNMREFIILNPDAIDKKRDGEKLWGKVTAYESWTLLGKMFVDPGISNDPQTPSPPPLAVIILSGGNDLSGGLYTPGSAAHALHAVLQGTGWSVGTVDVTDTHDLETEKKSVLANINQIQKTWGGYLIWDSINKTVSLRDEEAWAPYTGYQVRYAKNLKGITRTEDYDVVTKLYPFGADDLDISSVNGGKLYIENYSYTDEVLEEIWTNQDIGDPQKLLDEATKHLEKKYRPRYNYRVKQVDRRIQSGFQHEDYDIGHLVDIVDEELIQDFRLKYDDGHRYDTGLMYVDWFKNQTRVIGYKYNVFQPWKGEIEVGDPVEQIDAMVNEGRRAAKYLDKIKNSKDQISGYKLVNKSIIKEKIANSAIDASKINLGLIFLIDDLWTDDNPSAGYVSWSQHKIYWNGKEYTINSGSTNQKYIYWDNEASDYSFSGVLPSLTDSGFVIAVNNNGKHRLIWKQSVAEKLVGSEMLEDGAATEAKIANAAITVAKIANAAVGSAAIANAAILAAHIVDAAIQTAHIADLAVTDAKIDSLSANKIIAATLSAITADLGKVTSGEIYSAKFQSGAEGASDYVQIDTGNSPVKVVKNDKKALELWTSYDLGLPVGSGGAVVFYDTIANDQNGYIMAFNSGGSRGLRIMAEDSTGHSKDAIFTGSGVGFETESMHIWNPLSGATLQVDISGDLHVTKDLSAGGAKPAIHQTKNYGRRAMYARESPNLKFIEETVSCLTIGECRIELDPIFLETIEPHTEHTPWSVFCTPYADISLYVAEIGESYIVIRERDGGASNSCFSWSMSAFRQGFTHLRMKEYTLDEEVLTSNWEGNLVQYDTLEIDETVLTSDWEDDLL